MKRLVAVEVEVLKAKGEAEMKSWYVVSKCKNRMLSRIEKLSVTSFIALSIIVGTPAFADSNFNLWHEVDGQSVAVKHLNSEGETKAINWTVKDASEDSIKKFATAWSKEPVQFAEALQASVIAARKDGNFDSVKEKMTELFSKLSDSEYGEGAEGIKAKAAFDKMLEMILAMSEDDINDENFLKNLFESEEGKVMKELLGLTDKKVEEEVAEEGTEDDTKGDALAELQTKFANAISDIGKKASAAISAAEQAARNASARVPGEVDDSALQAQAQLICDKLNNDDDIEERVAREVDPALDAIAEVANQLARQPLLADNNQQENNALEDLLPALLQDALGQDEEQQIIPPQTAPAATPALASNDREDDENQFQAPEARPLPQQPQQLPPLQIPPTQSGGIRQAATLELPTTSGRQELRDAEDTLAMMEARTPVAVTMSPQPTIQEIVFAKAKVQGELSRVQADYQNAKDKAARLDEELEGLEEGARAALSTSTKKEEARLKQEVDKAKRAVENANQMAQQQAQTQDPMARQAMMAGIQSAQQALAAAEDQYNQFEQDIELKISEGNKKIKSLAKQRDKLESAAKKLQSSVSTLKEEETALTQMQNQQMQMQLQAIQAQYSQSSSTTKNVNTILQNSNSSGQPRSVVTPSTIGGTNLGSTTQTLNTQSSSGVIRAPLAQ